MMDNRFNAGAKAGVGVVVALILAYATGCSFVGERLPLKRMVLGWREAVSKAVSRLAY